MLIGKESPWCAAGASDTAELMGSEEIPVPKDKLPVLIGKEVLPSEAEPKFSETMGMEAVLFTTGMDPPPGSETDKPSVIAAPRGIELCALIAATLALGSLAM